MFIFTQVYYTKMKNLTIRTLQYLLGFKTYLFLFALFTFYKLKWDKNEKDFLKLIELISDDGLILDIGANIGVMTAYLALKRRNSIVFSFEPIPHNYNILIKIISFFSLSNVKTFNIALSDKAGKLEMIMPIINGTKKHGLCHVKTDGEIKYANFEEFNIEKQKLDNLEQIKNTELKISAIKIDVEGHELSVLKGSIKTLLKHKPVIYCELWPGEERTNTITFITELGYTTKVVVKNKLIDFTNQVSQNFFFISK